MSRYRNLVLFVSLAAVWGSAFMAIKAGLSYFPPVLFAAVRYDVAGVVMLGYAIYALDDPVPRGRGEWALVAVGSVLLIAAYHALLFVGVYALFYAPRSPPGEGFELTDPGTWLSQFEGTFVAPIQRFVGVRIDHRIRYGIGHPLLDYLTGYADLLATFALPTLALAVSAFLYDRYRPGTRRLIAFFAF
ncbi:EamA family transporter, partial [Halobium palmae]